MIRIEGVSKFFDDKAAVDSMDLRVEAGSLFGLIGPNGAGKTTTLKMLATLMKPDRGRITINGFDGRGDIRSVRRSIGYMPDSFGVFRGLTVEEYLQFFGRCYDLHGAELRRRIEDVLALAELVTLRDELTVALSTGMRQRLSLAKTLLHDPTLLLLDEPASGLDPRARIEIRSLLRELGKMGKTIVISSHILADLEEICTDVGIMELGKVVWQGSIQAVESAEAHRRTVEVEVAESEMDRALSVLLALDAVGRASRKGIKIQVEMASASGNEVLSALIGAGIEIRSFARTQVNLEALFLERTRGIVS
ncbi:MAG: ABC transporter ATP-binding protein [Planctomycetes bacterium]|nr:ABC transporter ATP-binding protein [Planctomycetota bacterium]